MRHLKKIKWLLVWLTISSLLIAACSPMTKLNKDTGFVYYQWSGLSALFKGEEFGLKSNYYKGTQYKGVDGPYIMYDSSGIVSYTVTSDNQLIWKQISRRDPLKVIVPNVDKDSFYITLKDALRIEPAVYEQASKILVISDIEGNFNGLHGFLISNEVIDRSYNWIFGNGQLVFLGDFVDRGEQVTQVLWLIYKLEQEAEKYNGRVHYILGNHEALSIQGRPGYADEKYVKVAQEISCSIPFNGAYKVLFSQKAELGKWLRTKNSIVKIGAYTFVHGGISPKILSFKPDIDKINSTIRENIAFDLYSDPQENDFANFLIGREGVLWFRGLVSDGKFYDKVSPAEFQQIRSYFNTGKIIIGHTLVENIQSDYTGGLIKIDVNHGKDKFSGKTKGLLIEDGIEYIVDDKGGKAKL